MSLASDESNLLDLSAAGHCPGPMTLITSQFLLFLVWSQTACIAFMSSLCQEWRIMLKHHNHLLCSPANLPFCTPPSCSYLRCSVRLLCSHRQYREDGSRKAAWNSRSISRVTLEHRDPQDLQGHPDLQGLQVWMDPVALRWVHTKLKIQLFNCTRTGDNLIWCQLRISVFVCISVFSMFGPF